LFLDLYWGFTHPDYRQTGIVDLIFTEATRRADELGLEMWLESILPMGVPIYMRHGFIPFRAHKIQPTTQNPDEEWKEIDKRLSPLRFWPMWRPASARYVEGETIAPWKLPILDGFMSKL
jgi:hypothetical protein